MRVFYPKCGDLAAERFGKGKKFHSKVSCVDRWCIDFAARCNAITPQSMAEWATYAIDPSHDPTAVWKDERSFMDLSDLAFVPTVVRCKRQVEAPPFRRLEWAIINRYDLR